MEGLIYMVLLENDFAIARSLHLPHRKDVDSESAPSRLVTDGDLGSFTRGASQLSIYLQSVTSVTSSLYVYSSFL